jgi:hypothetical protein
MQKWNAERRGITFLYTLEEWWREWDESGHWHQRGKGRNKYCMSRPRDQGPYAVGNVRIVTNEENRAEIDREKFARNGLKRAATIHAMKDEHGRSLVAMKMVKAVHAEKDELGRSIHAVKTNKIIHAKKDEYGRSVNAVKATMVAHAKKDEHGRSITAMKCAAAAHAKKDPCPCGCGRFFSPGPMTNHLRARHRSLTSIAGKRWR